MDRFVAFSGLGSGALFSDKHTARIASDASSPAGQILTSSCHEIFLEEVLRSKRRNAVFHDSDFRNPENVINPPTAYQQKAVVQFSTICLAHLLRYLHLNYVTSSSSPSCNYASGMCVGLLPAIAAATSSNLVGFLKQASMVYRLALLVGIATDEYHEASSLDATALYVDDMMSSELSALVEQHQKHTVCIPLAIQTGANLLTNISVERTIIHQLEIVSYQLHLEWNYFRVDSIQGAAFEQPKCQNNENQQFLPQRVNTGACFQSGPGSISYSRKRVSIVC